ncbi:MAG: ATP-grasp domain-containing protein [Anaerolineales bacterium]
MSETTVPAEEKPPSRLKPEKPWLVAVLANIKDENIPLPPDVAADALADYDHIETIDCIRAAIETDGHKTVFIQADRELPYALKEIKPDICFNIAEGLGGDAREAQVPALLEMLRIPYTHSRVMANAISLDKTLTKRIWRDRRLPVAPFQEFIVGDEPLRAELRFPLFVKPAREGTGMGVDAKAVVHSVAELRERVNYIIHTYRQPALVESFLSGREFTCGLIGRWDAKKYSRHPEWYDEKHGYHVFPVLELDSSRSVTPGVYSQASKSKSIGEEGAPGYICPAEISPELTKKLQSLVVKAHMALKAIDVSRTDIRLNAEGEPMLIEINTLPGLTPGYSDLCLEAAAEGIAYEDLILDILYLGASRWGMVEERETPPQRLKRTGSLKNNPRR